MICLLGVLARGIFVALVPVAPISDFARYMAVATNLVDGNGLSVSGVPFISQPPLYPGLLGGWLLMFGVDAATGKALNLMLSALTLVLWAWTCPRTSMRPGWQLASTALLAFHPALVAYTAILGTETLAVFLAILAFTLTNAPMRVLKFGLLGIVLALVALNRPQLLPLPVGVAIGVLCGGLDWQRARNCLILLAAFGAVLLPWALRNDALFDRFVPVSANSGYVLMVNNNGLNKTGNWMPLSQVPLSTQEQLRFQSEAGLPADFFAESDEDAKILQWTPAADSVARSVALDWMSEHPGEVLQLAVKRLETSLASDTLMYWPFLDVGGAPRWLEWLVYGLNVVLVLLAIFGAFRMLLRLRLRQLTMTQWLAVWMVLLGGLSIAMFEGQGRYLIPFIPAMLMLAAFSPGGSRSPHRQGTDTQ